MMSDNVKVQLDDLMNLPEDSPLFSTQLGRIYLQIVKAKKAQLEKDKQA